jgi:hypothetical protein
LVSVDFPFKCQPLSSLLLETARWVSCQSWVRDVLFDQTLFIRMRSRKPSSDASVACTIVAYATVFGLVAFPCKTVVKVLPRKYHTGHSGDSCYLRLYTGLECPSHCPLQLPIFHFNLF